MRRLFAISAAFLLGAATPAFALDLPPRKAGLWELKMSFDNGAIPVQTVKQCIDAETDKLMKTDFAGSVLESCEKQDVTKSGAAMVIDSTCTMGGSSSTTHAIVTGSFDSAYTMEITSKTRGDETRMTIAAKWLGACAADQRPGDMIMSNGMKMNVLDVKKSIPRLPQR